MKRKIVLFPLALAAIFGLSACGQQAEASSSSTPESSVSSSVVEVTVALNKTTLSLEVGGTDLLSATVKNAANSNVTWSTSDAAIATVDHGTVTAVKEGTCVITATSDADSTKKAECTVTVTKPALKQLGSVTGPVTESATYYGVVTAKTSKGFVIDDGTGALYVYKTLPSAYKVGDYVQVTDSIVAYFGLLETSSSATVAAMEGEAPTPKAATALTTTIIDTVQAQCTDGKQSGGTTGFHLADMGPYSFTLTADTSSGYTNFYLDEAKEYILSPMAYAGEAFQNGVEYEVKGYFAGKHSKGYYQFIVASATPHYKNVESISLDNETLSITALNDKQTLKASVLPVGANSLVTWTSSDTAVATVEDGVVTAVAVGTATITATSVGDTTKTASCVVTVTNESTITYTSVAKYDFSTLENDASLVDNTKIKAIFDTESYLTSGTNIVSTITGASNVYQGCGTNGALQVAGLKFGTSSKSGTFTIGTSVEVAKASLTLYTWNSSNLSTITVGDASYTCVAADATTATTQEFIFGDTQSVKIASSKRACITAIEFFTKTVA